MPPVSANPAWAALSVSGMTRSTDSLTTRSLLTRRMPALAVTASMDALPHTPQLEVV